MSALEVERINNAAEQLNSESADVLEYQALGAWRGRSLSGCKPH